VGGRSYGDEVDSYLASWESEIGWPFPSEAGIGLFWAEDAQQAGRGVRVAQGVEVLAIGGEVFR
jgi:hypothetical protein